MYILEERKEVAGQPDKWIMYARYDTSTLLEKMIATKKNPERFRIVKKGGHDKPRRNERCLTFKVYDIYKAGYLEGLFLDNGIEFVSYTRNDHVFFKVIRSGMKWHSILDMIRGVYHAKFSFASTCIENGVEYVCCN